MNCSLGTKILISGNNYTLIEGKASLERAKIMDVSSHFRNGWWYLCIYPDKNGRS